MDATTIFTPDKVAGIMKDMGLPEELIDYYMATPKFKDKIMAQFSQSSSFGAPPNPTFGEDALQNPSLPRATEEHVVKVIKMQKEKVARDAALSPTKVSPPSRSQIISLLDRSRIDDERSESVRSTGGIAYYTTFVGLPRIFSRVALTDLTPIYLSSMLVHQRHDGRYLFCRIITEPTRQITISFGIEDLKGSAGKVVISNFPTLTFGRAEEMDAIFPLGTIFAIREPTYKMSGSGDLPFLQVDSPSDLIFLSMDNAFLRGFKWSSGINFPQGIIQPTSVDSWRAIGASHFKAQRWLASAMSFTNGLNIDPQSQVLRLNRSEAYLRLGWYHSAFRDAQSVLLSERVTDATLECKAVVRSTKSLYYIGRFADAIEMAAHRLDDETCREFRKKSSDRLLEESSGRYNWTALFRESQDVSANLEVAEFTGPVCVKTANGVGGGRGVFVTRDVKMGELLMVSKPIATSPVEVPEEECFRALNCFQDIVISMRAMTLMTSVIEKLWDNPNLASIIKALYAGPDLEPATDYPPPVSSIIVRTIEHSFQSAADIDVGRVEGICSFNSFCLASLGKADTSPDTSSPSGVRTAVYSLPSLCNHSCLPSATQAFFGDIAVIRARRNLNKGDEVTITYVAGDATFKSRQYDISAFGFVCHCPLCEADRADGKSICDTRDRIYSQFFKETTVNKAAKLIEDLNRTYKDTPERRELSIKPALFHMHRRLGRLHMAACRGTDRRTLELSIKEYMKGIQALGIVILDNSVAGKIKRKGGFPIGTTRGPSHSSDKCVLDILTIAGQFFVLRDSQRAESWVRSALFVEDITTGGGPELFALRYKDVLVRQGWSDFVHRVLKG